MNVGRSPADWPVLPWLGEDQWIKHYSPDIIGPYRSGRLPIASFYGRNTVQATVMPNGKYLMIELSESSADAGIIVSVELADLTKFAWFQRLPNGTLQLSNVRGDAYQIHDDYCGNLLFVDAATGAESRLNVGPGVDTSIVTAPWQSAFAGHYAVCITDNDQPELTGYAAASEHAAAPEPLWRIQLPWMQALSFRLSACGGYYDVLSEGCSSLYSIATGRLTARFEIDNPHTNYPVVTVGAIDVGRYLCYIVHRKEMQVQFVIVGASAVGVPPAVVRATRHVTFDLRFENLKILPRVGRRDISLVAGTNYVFAVANATAEPLHIYHLAGTSRTLAVWERRPEACAQAEHERALLAVAAIDELPTAIDGSADSGSAVGLVRAVLAGFVAEDARVTALQSARAF